MLRKFVAFGLLFSGCSTAGVEVTPCIHGPAGYGCDLPDSEVKLDDAALEHFECYSPEDARAIREWIKRRFMPGK